MEPSAVQRAVLLARVVDDPSLSGRVTAIASGAEAVQLPDRLGGVLAMNMIGPLQPSQRRRLRQRIADRLAPGAPLVLNLQPPVRVEAVPETDFTAVQIGRHRYLGSGRAEPDGPDTVVWHMRYRVCDEHGHVEREIAAQYRWHAVAPEAARAELSAVGFAVEHGPYGLIRAAR